MIRARRFVEAVSLFGCLAGQSWPNKAHFVCKPTVALLDKTNQALLLLFLQLYVKGCI